MKTQPIELATQQVLEIQGAMTKALKHPQVSPRLNLKLALTSVAMDKVYTNFHADRDKLIKRLDLEGKDPATVDKEIMQGFHEAIMTKLQEVVTIKVPLLSVDDFPDTADDAVASELFRIFTPLTEEFQAYKAEMEAEAKKAAEKAKKESEAKPAEEVPAEVAAEQPE